MATLDNTRIGVLDSRRVQFGAFVLKNYLRTNKVVLKKVLKADIRRDSAAGNSPQP